MRACIEVTGLTLLRSVAIVEAVLGKRGPLQWIRPLGCSKNPLKREIILEDPSQQSVLNPGSLSLLK